MVAASAACYCFEVAAYFVALSFFGLVVVVVTAAVELPQLYRYFHLAVEDSGQIDPPFQP